MTARPITMSRRLLAATLLCLASHASQATSALSIYGGCGLNTGYPDHFASLGECSIPSRLQIDLPPGTVLAAEDGVVSTHAGSASAQGYASFGALGAMVNATAYNSAGSASPALANNGANARMLVEFGDTLTFNALGLNGQKGTVFVNWRFDGSGGTFVGGPAPVLAQQSSMTWELSVFTPYATFTQSKVLITNPEHPDAQSALLTPITLAIPVVFGQRTFVHAALDIGVAASAGVPNLSPDDPSYLMTRSAGAYANLMHTVAWDGIEQIVDAQGQALPGWAVTSESGTNYRYAISAVPEPASAGLMLAGLCALAAGAGVKRRRESRDPPAA